MSGRAPDARGGYTLAEATLALLLAGVLTLCLAGILSVVGRLASRYERVGTEAETERVAAAVLGFELRSLTAADAHFHADSVRLRAFRGVGVVCSWEAGALVVRYRGARAPEPDKDSVVLVWPAGETIHGLGSVDGGASCATAEGEDALALDLTSWTPRTSPERPVLALVFETGAYSISGAALRYRRGAGGRQPITETILSDAESGIVRVTEEGTSAATALVRLLSAPDRSVDPRAGRVTAVVWRVRMPQGAVRPALLEP